MTGVYKIEIRRYKFILFYTENDKLIWFMEFEKSNINYVKLKTCVQIANTIHFTKRQMISSLDSCGMLAQIFKDTEGEI